MSMSAVESDIGVPRLKRQEVLYKFACAFICISAILFFTVFLPAARSFPWSDEWDYLRAVDLHGISLVRWLFEQHVDHRIPLQKALYLWLLHRDAYDYRVMFDVNFSLVCLTDLLG